VNQCAPPESPSILACRAWAANDVNLSLLASSRMVAIEPSQRADAARRRSAAEHLLNVNSQSIRPIGIGARVHCCPNCNCGCRLSADHRSYPFIAVPIQRLGM
jgi:hypothetical protein